MRHRLTLATILIAIPLAVATATPGVRLHVPPPGRYGIEDLWKATVTSDTACDAWFEGLVYEESHGQIFWARTRPFPLTRGVKVYGYRSVALDQTRTAPGYEAFVTRQGTLPQGIYRFKLILQPFGIGDSNGFEVKPLGPPRLLTPRQGDSIVQEPVFSWTPPTNSAGGVTYRLRIVEVLAGQGDEEALRSNPPWFEMGGIRGTSLRYPGSGRKLEESKRYAWEVIAEFGGGFGSIVSEHRRFSKFGLRPPVLLHCPLEVTRTVGRIGTYFLISAKIRNTSAAPVKNIKLDVRSFGFQWVQSDTFQNLWSTGDGTECRWSVKRKELAGGASFFAITMAVPVLGGPALTQRTLFDSVRVSCDIGTNRVGKSPNLAWSDPVQIDAAFTSANYLLVTRPSALYGKFAHFQVHDVLSAMAVLASRKSGVLGYVPPVWWRADIRAALGPTGAWGRHMRSDWAKGTGYLLIVGDSDIVASFSPSTTWYPEHNGGQVRTSDFSYANLTGDLRPELRVGRLPGSPNDILPGLKTALDNATPGQKAWLVGGPDGTWEPNVKDVETARFLLQFKGISTERTHTEYVETKQNQLREAIHIRLYENGTPADSTLKAYLKDRTEWQYAVGLLWLTGSKYRNLPLLTSLETAIGWAVMLEDV
ncbi:hypothetical protein JXD38_01695, partial [candidate division WOR-3 bacterium]|nr:hypothetical protein [candidate division WOR-3 bacterium]